MFGPLNLHVFIYSVALLILRMDIGRWVAQGSSDPRGGPAKLELGAVSPEKPRCYNCPDGPVLTYRRTQQNWFSMCVLTQMSYT